MKRLIMTFLAVFSLGVAVVGFQASTGVVAAETPKQAVCKGASGSTGCTTGGGPTVNKIIATAVNILSLLVGVAAVIMIVYGGFRYITSGGDSGKVSGAKSTILYAVVGLLVAALAQSIVRFVLDEI